MKSTLIKIKGYILEISDYTAYSQVCIIIFDNLLILYSSFLYMMFNESNTFDLDLLWIYVVLADLKKYLKIILTLFNLGILCHKIVSILDNTNLLRNTTKNSIM